MCEGTETGSGNIFADLGFADAEVMQTKLRLAVSILNSIETRGLTQKQAASIARFSQRDSSDLRGPRIDSFTIDRLLRILLRLDPTVELKVSTQTRDDAHLLVSAR